MDLMSLQGLSLVEGMNKDFEKLSAEERLARLFEIVPEEEVLVTSSFGIHSATLLHHLSRIKPGIKVYFINTRFHFQQPFSLSLSLFSLCEHLHLPGLSLFLLLLYSPPFPGGGGAGRHMG